MNPTPKPGVTVTRSKRPVLLAAACLVFVASVSCSAAKRIEQAELARARVSDDFRLVDEGVHDRSLKDFVFRVYLGPPDVLDPSIVDPPNRYVPFPLIRNFRQGWRPLAGWRGPSSDQTRECLLALESAADAAHVADVLTPGERAQVASGRRVLIRVSVSCSTRQHSFD